MISFKSVPKSYGSVHALRDLTLDPARGEIFGYIGPNGAGKTTTIKILSSLNHVDMPSAIDRALARAGIAEPCRAGSPSFRVTS